MNKPCSLHCFLSILIVGLFAQCQAPKAEENNITELKPTQKEDSNASNQIIEDRAISYQSQSCVFDSAKFSQKMGIGVASISFKVENIPVFSAANRNDSIGFLHLKWHALTLHLGNDSINVKWFLHPTEYRNGSVIALESKGDFIRIKINAIKKDFWIESPMPKDFQIHAQFIPWTTYLNYNTLWITKSVLQQNPIRETPNDTADTIGFEYKYSIFQIHEIKHPWILVSTLLEKSDMEKTSDVMSPPLGWIKWYCNDTMQVRFPDTYELEAFYLDQ